MKKKKLKIALIFGTRPEIIKLSALMRLLHKERRPYILVHTGQHYSYEMDKLFFKELELPAPGHLLSCRSESGRHGDHTGRMMTAIEKVMLSQRPDVVLVQGDTNSVLAGALVSAKLSGIRVGHVEAGLRSYDRAMPEEVNRMVADHISDYLFPPTPLSKKILLGEGIPASKIFVTGNTIVDAVQENLAIAKRKVNLNRLIGKNERFFLTTLHRQENVDHKDRLAGILEGLRRVSRRYGHPVLFPAHPRTTARIQRFGLKIPREIRILKPEGFLSFLLLEKNARLILSDSGGVQEEACILGVPCVTLRTSTERPETVKAGGNVLAGFDPKKIESAAARMLDRKASWKNPFGDGKASRKILNFLDSRAR